MPHCLEAERLARALGDRPALADALEGIGYAYMKLGESRPALDYYNRAIRLYEELGDPAGAASVLTGRCAIHRRLGDHPRALEDCFAAHGLLEGSADRGGLTEVLNNIGLVYSSLGQSDQALEYFQKALELQPPDGSCGSGRRRARARCSPSP